MGIKPFHDITESSSDEIKLGDFGYDPFVENNILKMIEIKQTEKSMRKGYEGGS